MEENQHLNLGFQNMKSEIEACGRELMWKDSKRVEPGRGQPTLGGKAKAALGLGLTTQHFWVI